MNKIKCQLGIWFICPHCQKDNTHPIKIVFKEYEKPYRCECGEKYSYNDIISAHNSIIKPDEEKIVHCQIWTCTCNHQNHIRNPTMKSENHDDFNITMTIDELLMHKYGLCEQCGKEFNLGIELPEWPELPPLET